MTTTKTDIDPKAVFTKKDEARILAAKAGLAKVINAYVPLVLTDKSFGFQDSWCIAGGLFPLLVNQQVENSTDLDIWIFTDQAKISTLLKKRPGIKRTDAYGGVTKNIDFILEEERKDGPKTQYIFTNKLVKTPEDIVASFDYVHCQPYYYKHTMFVSKYQIDAICKKHLIMTNTTGQKPLRNRIEKWINRGYTAR